MEELLKESVKQVPALAVLCVVVWLFLKFMDKVWSSMQSLMQEFHKDHLQARTEAREAMNRLADAIATCPLKVSPNQDKQKQ